MRFVETDIMRKIVYSHIVNEKKKNKREAASYFYATDGYLPENHDESKCARQIGYKLLGYEEEEVSEEQHTVFALGDLYHEFIQQIFVKEKLATQVEDFTIMYDDDGKYYWIRKDSNKVVIKIPVEIHGRLDLKFEIDTNKFIADIKTLNERAWKFLQGKPKEAHYLQMQIYLHHLKIDNGFLLYINKSTGEMKEFMLQYDQEYVLKALDNFKNLEEYIRTKGLPKRHFKSREAVPWQCKYCGFTKHCLGLANHEVLKRTFVAYPEDSA